jgi:hypothetical protein
VIRSVLYEWDPTRDPLPRHYLITRTKQTRLWFRIVTRCCCRHKALRQDRVPVAERETVSAAHTALRLAHLEEEAARFQARMREVLR